MSAIMVVELSTKESLVITQDARVKGTVLFLFYQLSCNGTKNLYKDQRK